MSENIVKFRPRDYADNPDNILTEAVGDFSQVLLIGYDKDGEFNFRGTISDGGEILWLVENFRHKLLSGDFVE